MKHFLVISGAVAAGVWLGPQVAGMMGLVPTGGFDEGDAISVLTTVALIYLALYMASAF
jgi:hypothetical protein